ncbi:MAG: hypothetical protein COZ91_00315 [Candidatus Nealsonbacteria bacterium CG_4_8_14_3_um_filter_39_7]|uniref:Peptidase A2 domain-containing protein n=1 Tax=Candidatus Nealsonbacteria bacterium CG23_combo_of_CG06-09_8_20_14_all_39_17 TaxID=1974722 RepID=A0A2G9YUX1_9BACT|nr:MAG: hypothetical protein COX37_00570 [Candidatus Nealsonbacteria bacterium CG23_combo_of_CG06-09_8_20_14_all_39_17]PIU43685.1 MAG: hypothetical protein COS96_03030 [Candidatus Nealsonbacteria bacterium CG07_land_8_20_14_0_80_39_13]PIW91728.1 MAG: hypothetical protein COZ91_00315 [Candidatus Nealsonbacteria bacterium CG_4_8_14_3_um_filter_39_7]
MKFSYKKYGTRAVRPVIPVELSYKDRSISYEVLVDSGADFCIFDAQIGELLGIEIKDGKKEEVAGITGVIQPYYVHDIIIKIGGWPYEIKAGFLPNIAQLSYGVVGQIGFFDIFIVRFDLLKGEIDLNRRNFSKK